MKLDRDITIDSLAIRGFASPEGSWAANARLAKGRTEALVDYVTRLHSFPRGVIHSSYDPEDWAGLRRAVAESNLDDKGAMLAVIDNAALAPDARDQRLRREFPEQYNFLLQSVFPRLRRSDYTIHYRIRNYTDPAEIIAVARANPSKLSLEEIYFASRSFEPGTPEYQALWDAALRLDPSSVPAAVNAANAAMASGDLRRASSILSRAQDSPEVVYARGNLAALEGRLDDARRLFGQAARMRVSDAPAALARLNALSSAAEITPLSP